MANQSLYDFNKLVAPDASQESLGRFTRRLNEILLDLYLKVGGTIEMSDLSSKTQAYINKKVGTDQLNTFIEQTNEAISLKADQVEVDSLGNTVSQHSTEITANANAISQKASQSSVNSLGETVDELSASVEMIPGQIEAEVTDKTIHTLDTPPALADLWVGKQWLYSLVDPPQLLKWRGGTENNARSYHGTKSGASVTIYSLSEDRALDVTVKTIADQAGSGTPSPSNVRPVSGKASVTLTVNGADYVFAPPHQMLGLASAPDTIKNDGSVRHQTDAIVLNGSENWTTNPGWAGNAYVLSGAIPQAQSISGYGTVADLMCSHFPAATPAAIADGALGIGIGNGTEIYVGFPDESVVPRQNLTAFKAWLAANPVVLVYRLNTPSNEAVAPVEIVGIDGTNTVTSDGTEVSVTYTGSGWSLVSSESRGVIASTNVKLTAQDGLVIRQVTIDGQPVDVEYRCDTKRSGYYQVSDGAFIGGLRVVNGTVHSSVSAISDPRVSSDFLAEIETALNYDGNGRNRNSIVLSKGGAEGGSISVQTDTHGELGGVNIGGGGIGFLVEAASSEQDWTENPDTGSETHAYVAGSRYGTARLVAHTSDAYSRTASVEVDSSNADEQYGIVRTTGHLRPETGWGGGSGVFNIGDSSERYRRGYFTLSPDVSSDARLKQDITDIDGDLIMRLRPRAFRLKAEPNKLRFGLIAQEVKEALDACGIEDADLYGDDNPESLSLVYEELIAPLIAAVQEQKAEVDNLKAEVSELKSYTAALEARLAALEAKIV